MSDLSPLIAFFEVLKIWKRGNGLRNWNGTSLQLREEMIKCDALSAVQKKELPNHFWMHRRLHSLAAILPEQVLRQVKMEGGSRWEIRAELEHEEIVHDQGQTGVNFLPCVEDRPDRGELWARFAAAYSSRVVVSINPEVPGSAMPGDGLVIVQRQDCEHAASFADLMLEKWDQRYGHEVQGPGGEPETCGPMMPYEREIEDDDEP